MIPGPQNNVEEKKSEIAQLRQMSYELKVKLEQAQEKYTQLNNECLRLFIYEKPKLARKHEIETAREFAVYYENSSRIELEALIESDKILLAAFESRQVLAKEFSDSFLSKQSDESLEKSLLEKQPSLLHITSPSKDENSTVSQDKLPTQDQSKKYKSGS